MSLTRENIEAYGFEYVPVDGKTKTKSDFVYSKEAVGYPFEVWEAGEFMSAHVYTTLIRYDDSDFIRIYSNINYVGDPSNMSTIFVGRIKDLEQFVTILRCTGLMDELIYE